MSKINFEPNFDPNTWCDDSTDTKLKQNPIKKLVCFFLDIIDILSPLTAFAATLLEFIVKLVYENKDILDLIMIILPSIPLFLLINYFMNTL